MKRVFITALVLVFTSLSLTSCTSNNIDAEISEKIDAENETETETETESETETTAPDPDLLTDFWFGYRYESPVTNPEDPEIGFVYMKIPDTGEFEGELHFSWNGCSEGVDVGKVTGTVGDGTLIGTWSGFVDGLAVGGSYSGNLNENGIQYEGVYDNEEGKIEVECDEDLTYYIAPDGTWFIQKNGRNEELDITVETDQNPLLCRWNELEGAIGYNVIFIDADCLDEKLNIEDCYMWDANTQENSVRFGEVLISTIAARPLVRGEAYLVTVTALNFDLEPMATNNITFVY